MSRRVVAVVVALLALGEGVASLVLIALTASAELPDQYGFRGQTTVYAVTSVLVGLPIALRQPRNLIPWLFLGTGAFGGLYPLASAYVDYSLPTRGSAADVVWAAWLMTWTWIPAPTVIPVLLPFVFPDGRALSPRWRALGWLAALNLASFAVLIALLPDLGGPQAGGVVARNPVSPFASGLLTYEGVRSATFPLLALSLVAAVAALVQRFRSAGPVTRLQLKWVVYAVALNGFITVLIPFLQTVRAFQVVNVLAVNAIPIAAGIAILRYRLYDIDLLINRTLVYGALSATLVATYAAFVILLQSALRPFTGGSELAVAASTLATLALVQPFRRRIQDAVDRRFYRRRYDAARILDAFSARLRDEVDLDAVRTDLLDVVGRAVEPAHATLWLKAAAR